MRRTSIERNGAMEKSESGKFDDTGIVLQDNSRGAGRLGRPGKSVQQLESSRSTQKRDVAGSEGRYSTRSPCI